MLDMNGKKVEPGDIIYINHTSTKYIFIQYNEEDNTFLYRRIGDFIIWCGDYDYYKNTLSKAIEFSKRKKDFKIFGVNK